MVLRPTSLEHVYRELDLYLCSGGDRVGLPSEAAQPSLERLGIQDGLCMLGEIG